MMLNSKITNVVGKMSMAMLGALLLSILVAAPAQAGKKILTTTWNGEEAEYIDGERMWNDEDSCCLFDYSVG